MNKKLKLQIINLAKFIFEDAEYVKFITYLQNNKLNDLRLLVDEKVELLSIVNEFGDADEVVLQQIEYCDELENLVMDVFIGEMKVN